MLRCAITEGSSIASGLSDLSELADLSDHSDLEAARARLLEQARRWAREGIEFIQLRERHLEAGALLHLAEAMLQILRANGTSQTKLLVNRRADVAAAAGADGVHLTSREGELMPEQVRAVFAHAGRPAPVVSVSCHTLDEVRRAKDNRADYILFGPVFEKRVAGELVGEGFGLERLHAGCVLAGEVPVLALGGVTSANMEACLAAGARGIAGIRLFA